MKKIIYLLLAVAVQFNTVASVYASQTYNDLQYTNNQINSEEDFYSSNNINYYFYKNNEYIYSMSSHGDDIYCVINDKSNNKIYEKYFYNVPNNSYSDFVTLKKNLNIEDFSENKNFESMKNQGSLYNTVNELSTYSSTTASSLQKVRTYLKNKYGDSYYNKFIASKTSKGKTAKIYETKTLSAINDEGWKLLIGIAITSCSSITGIPVRILKSIAFTKLKDGVEVLLYGTTITKYKATVCYVKQASIKGGVYAQAFKDIIGKAYVGNKNYINYTYIKTRESGAATYNDHQTLFRVAFNNL